VLLHLLERVEALEQRPIPGTVELAAPTPEAAPVDPLETGGLTLPLSGRQGDCGGEAQRCWWPVHSRGLFDGLPFCH